MAERRRIDWREGLAIGGGECLLWVALWSLGGIGFVLTAALIAGTSRFPAVFVPVITGLLALISWGVVLSVRHRPGLYLEHLTEERRASLGSGWGRRLRLIAMASVQLAVLATLGYISWVITFD